MGESEIVREAHRRLTGWSTVSPNHDIGHHDPKNSKNHHNRHNPDPVEIVPFCQMSVGHKDARPSRRC